MSLLLDDNTRRKLEQTVRRIVAEVLEEEVWTACPGTILSYDPATRKASVQPKGKLRYLDQETGKVVEEVLAVIENVPVHFGGGGDFEWVWDLTPPEPCWLKFSKTSLENWLSTGDDGPAGQVPPFQLSDAVAEVGLRTLGDPGNPCPPKTMRLGAKDGPQIIWDLIAQKLTFSSINEIDVLAALLVRIKSDGDVFIQDRRVDPHTPEDI